MIGTIRAIVLILISGVLAGPAFSAPKILLQVSGSYFAYSYDLNQLYGENVEFEFGEYKIAASYLKIALTSRSFCVLGAVTLVKGPDTHKGDEFWFSAEGGSGTLLTYGETVSSIEIGEKGDRLPASLNRDAEKITLFDIKKSLIYFTARKIEITSEYEVQGYQVTLFLEGIESVGFSKINMTSGLSREIAGITIEKIWFNKTQGLITRLSHAYEKQDRISSFAHLTYEERSMLKNYEGLQRQFDLMASLTANLGGDFTLAANGNYNSSQLWNMNAFLNKKWSTHASSQVSFAYNKPVLYEGEAWLGLQSSFQGNRLGSLSAGGRFGKDSQFLGNFSYTNSFFKRLGLNMMSSYSNLRPVGGGDPSKIWTGNMMVSYRSTVFNLSADYFLNRDLVGHQSLSQPRLQLSTVPQTIYGDLLRFSGTNILIFNESLSLDSRQRSYSNNLIFNMTSVPVFITKQLSTTLSFSLEQFMEKSRRNFVSSGVVVNIRQEFSEGIFLEGFYSAQARRKPQDWMVEGTTSQDMSLVFRVNKSARFSTWFSLSYDPKYNELRNSFAEVSLRIFRAWEFHALGAYDFAFNKINNVDIHIVRKAGRFQLRFVWRSLSRQFLLELMPQ